MRLSAVLHTNINGIGDEPRGKTQKQSLSVNVVMYVRRCNITTSFLCRKIFFELFTM